MAERGAHLSQLLLDTSRPSIFELVAQEGLNQAFRGTVKFVFKVCANNYPEVFGPTFRWANEIQLLFDVCLQNYYLRNYGASFAENFYGLERVTKDDTSLDFKGKIRSLLSLTVLPYTLSKLDGYFTERRQSRGQFPAINYASIRFVYDIIVLANWMLYTWGKSLTHSPVLHLMGLKLKHGGDNASPGLSLTKIIELGAFFIQFLEWWFANQSSQAKSILSLPIPPAPHSTAHGQHPKTKQGVCPICQQPWRNECVLRVSGFVYCYRCIAQHLRESGTCPVTKLPATTNDLIRIFANVE